MPLMEGEVGFRGSVFGRGRCGPPAGGLRGASVLGVLLCVPLSWSKRTKGG